jgi:hypothetical protein
VNILQRHEIADGSVMRGALGRVERPIITIAWRRCVVHRHCLSAKQIMLNSVASERVIFYGCKIVVRADMALRQLRPQPAEMPARR